MHRALIKNVRYQMHRNRAKARSRGAKLRPVQDYSLLTKPLSNRWFRTKSIPPSPRASDPAGLEASRVYIMLSRPYKTPSERSDKCDIGKVVLCVTVRKRNKQHRPLSDA